MLRQVVEVVGAVQLQERVGAALRLREREARNRILFVERKARDAARVRRDGGADFGAVPGEEADRRVRHRRARRDARRPDQDRAVEAAHRERDVRARDHPGHARHRARGLRVRFVEPADADEPEAVAEAPAFVRRGEVVERDEVRRDAARVRRERLRDARARRLAPVVRVAAPLLAPAVAQRVDEVRRKHAPHRDLRARHAHCPHRDRGAELLAAERAPAVEPCHRGPRLRDAHRDGVRRREEELPVRQSEFGRGEAERVALAREEVAGQRVVAAATIVPIPVVVVPGAVVVVLHERDGTGGRRHDEIRRDRLELLAGKLRAVDPDEPAANAGLERIGLDLDVGHANRLRRVLALPDEVREGRHARRIGKVLPDANRELAGADRFDGNKTDPVVRAVLRRTVDAHRDRTSFVRYRDAGRHVRRVRSEHPAIRRQRDLGKADVFASLDLRAPCERRRDGLEVEREDVGEVERLRGRIRRNERNGRLVRRRRGTRRQPRAERAGGDAGGEGGE